ncbi:MAG TPA: hypothetical protein VE136_09300, partial [Anaerolineales bacterium]|nr:hypothetical protein [Anaerolineales bacterium]
MSTKRTTLHSAPRFAENHLNILLLLSVALFLAGLGGCNFPANQNLPTPLPPEYIPTVIALTVEAQRASDLPATQPALSPPAQDDREQPGVVTPTLELTPTPPPSLTALAPLAPTETPASPPNPDIPFGTIQILNPGPASRLTSPFLFKAYLLPGDKGRVRIELLGEDGRLLMREVKVYDVPQGARVTVGSEVEFEIS